MAIKISGSTIIDDSRNIVNAGIVTATSFSGDGSGLTGVGIGSEGSINTSGIVTASKIVAAEYEGSGDKLIFSPTVTSFSPTDGATDIEINTNIILTFNQPIYAGVGSIFLRDSSPDAGIGTEIEAIGISSSMISNQTLTINPSGPLPLITDVYVVLPQGVITNAVSGVALSLTTYNFTTVDSLLGTAYEGGYLICQSGGTNWIVAPASTEVSRSWNSRNDAVTTANANAACGDWFVPSVGQLQNPGYVCRTYWDSYSADWYRSNTEHANTSFSSLVNFSNGTTIPYGGKPQNFCVRAFRCVSY